MPRHQKRVTLEEVARIAGVSRATVSRVVNGVASVDESIRRTVEKAISTTGYLPNLAARSLVTRRADAVALVLPSEDRIVGDPFFTRIVRGVSGVLSPLGVHLVLMTTSADTGDQVVADLRQGRLDGVILVHTYRADPLPNRLVRGRQPVVLSARPADPIPITYVDVNQTAGGALAAEHLVARGCHRVATITGSLDRPPGHDRLAGFCSAMARLGQPGVICVEGDFTRQSGAAAMRRLITAHPEVDGVFIASDLMAEGALPVLREHGRRVPDDVAVVGFDDSSAALSCDPPLTTVRQPVEDMAAEMARQLLKQVDQIDTPIRSVIFEPSLVIRQSA
ncbi:LacI family DNA-binding transcriptional regulator [Kibdelosporangium phytohabitans]|uniref:LacI family DNA-binding transcriptional regulator n=1 Tax=Kibdelosporangium phytohabitans TaxID=860235 RepID=UPI000A4B7C5D|nr:LacI family DNA-binding transcriptional regulator [Kibdelosporangium phytohabitans]MBE1468377.1 DNA-binding LacI/PurR family transcriptional regulator [Kibdelosporangium phytohabitans]